MPLSRHSKIKEAMQNPVAHDFLQSLARRMGRPERWLSSPLVANMALFRLDRLAGPGACDTLLKLAAHDAGPECPPCAAAEATEWWAKGVIYQIYVPSFMDADHDGVGDFAGVAQRLPYLKQLGVETLWLCPVADENERGHAVRSFTDVRPDLGTMEDFERLVKQAHGQDMRVIISLSIAFTAEEHPWFGQTQQGKGGSYILRAGTPQNPPNNWLRPSGASAWVWHEELDAWALHLNGRSRVELNWDNASVRRDVAEALQFWQKAGVDGFYLGPVHALSKYDYEDGHAAGLGITGLLGYERFAGGPKLHSYLHELRAGLQQPVFLAGELRGTGTDISRMFTTPGREELDMVLNKNHLMGRQGRGRRGGATGALSLQGLKQYYLRWMERCGNESWIPLYLESPDMPRIVSRLGAGGLYRATLAKLLGMMMFTLRGVPIIYQGQELGLPNTQFTRPQELHDAKVLRQLAECPEAETDKAAFGRLTATAYDHARTPMPWRAGPGAGFTGATPWMRLPDGTDFLNVACQLEDKGSVLRYYQRLVALRNSHRALVNGCINPVFAKNKQVFCYFRICDDEKWYVEMNLTERQVPRPGRLTASHKLMVSNYDLPGPVLRPYEANLYLCE